MRPPDAVIFALTLALLLPTVGRADDPRLGPPQDLNGFFPFEPPASKEAWAVRGAAVRRRVLVSQGLWPMPTRHPLAPRIHGTIDRDGYTVSKVVFESLPGFFVTGNLYRPTGAQGKVPGVLFAHGHWKDARLSENPADAVRREIAAGAERFEQGARSRFQSLCVQLARMGCVVWQWDMIGDSDSRQLSRELAHGFTRQRADMSAADAWGLYSPQAEARLQSVMGLQTWNSIRSLDFLLSLPEVDPERVAMTGSSGGGTQTMLLAAVDDRLKLSFPVVMVSTSMQGGCTCENASLLRIGTGNVEIAGLFAPKPQGMNTADDWTRELATKGFPELQRLYDLLGARENVMLHRGEHFPHNYNAVTRSAFYTFLNRRFGLGFPEPVIERDYEPLSRAELSVWDDAHPAPPEADPRFERDLLSRLAADIDAQVRQAAATPAGLRDLLMPAIETVIGRGYAEAGESQWKLAEKHRAGGSLRLTGVLHNTTHDEEVAVEWLYPEPWSGQVVIWLAPDGPLVGADDTPSPPVRSLLEAGATVVAPHLFHRKVGPRQPVVNTPREFAGYTFGYNHPAFCRSVHDVLSLVHFLRTARVGGHAAPTEVSVVGFGDAAPVALAARALAGQAIDRAAVATDGFRFAALTDYRHPLFVPGAVRYLDVPGMIALAAPHPLWLAGEGADAALLPGGYPAAGRERLTLADPGEADPRGAAVAWLLGPTPRAGGYGRVIFSDDFSAAGFGPRWGHYKSSSEVRDGVLVGITASGSDHSAVDNIRFDGERDLEVALRFRFTSDQARSFNVWFDDKAHKGSHAGHICQATVSPKGVSLSDAKTGGFALEGGLYDRKKANALTAEEKAWLATKSKWTPFSVTLHDWHTLVVRTAGEEISVSIDGRPVASFASPGIGHATKSLVSLTTNPIGVEYDDFSIKAADGP